MRTENIANPDMVKIIDDFMTSMEFDEEGNYVRNLTLIDKFEESHILKDENSNVIDCSYNSSLTGFCAALRADAHPNFISNKAA